MRTPIWLLVFTLALGGCTAATPAFDAGFGQATRALLVQQTGNPDASQTNRGRSVEGIDGRSAREIHERYVNGYAEPVKPAPIINIGGGGGR